MLPCADGEFNPVIHFKGVFTVFTLLKETEEQSGAMKKFLKLRFAQHVKGILF